MKKKWTENRSLGRTVDKLFVFFILCLSRFLLTLKASMGNGCSARFGLSFPGDISYRTQHWKCLWPTAVSYTFLKLIFGFSTLNERSVFSAMRPCAKHTWSSENSSLRCGDAELKMFPHPHNFFLLAVFLSDSKWRC